jgi:hypothetical protein
MKSRIMYIESKASGLTGSARIGRVTFSKCYATLYYGRDSLCATHVAPEVDSDVYDEYWSNIRGMPDVARKRESIRKE